MSTPKVLKPAKTVYGLAVAASLSAAHFASAQSTFVPTSGTAVSWNTAGNWSPTGVPSGTDVAVIFNPPTATETVALGASQTVGSLTEHDNSASTLTLNATTGLTLTFSATSGTAAFLVDGTGTAVNTVISALVLTSSLDITVNNTSVTSSSGAVTFTTASMTGAGGVIKDGDGTASMTTAAKAYTGATTINGGVLRFSATGAPTGTSGVTVNSGGQLRLDSSAGAFSFGGGAVTIALNGAGDANLAGTAGTGALANYGSGASTLANPVSVATASTIFTNAGTLALNGIVSGSGALTKSGTSILLFNNANNTQSGLISVAAGTLGGSGTINAPVTVSTSATLLAGASSATTTLTLSKDLTLSSGSIIGLTLGTGSTHSTLARTGGTWSFDPTQMFALSGTLATGTYDNIITGLAADPGTESNWTFTNNGAVGTFTFDGANIDLTLTAVPVPEPATTFGGILLIGAAGWSLRRRVRGLLPLA